MCYFRGFSDIPYGRELSELAHAKEQARSILGQAFDDAHYLAVTAEARFKKINACVKNFKNYLEVASGLSPRGLLFTEDASVNFLATDLPNVSEQRAAIVSTVIETHNLTRPHLGFIGVNALKMSDMLRASALLPPGPIAIISEGFMIYLTKSEKARFLEIVGAILRQRHGALITSDVLISDPHHPIQSPALQAIARATGRDMRELGFNNHGEAREFFSSLSLYAEVLSPLVEVSTIHSLGLQQDPRALSLARLPVWVLTAKQVQG